MWPPPLSLPSQSSWRLHSSQHHPHLNDQSVGKWRSATRSERGWTAADLNISAGTRGATTDSWLIRCGGLQTAGVEQPQYWLKRVWLTQTTGNDSPRTAEHTRPVRDKDVGNRTISATPFSAATPRSWAFSRERTPTAPLPAARRLLSGTCGSESLRAAHQRGITR